MCLGIPGKVIDIRDEAGLAMGRVDFGGVRKDACLAYLPEVEVGDYVIVHVGSRSRRWTRRRRCETLEILAEMGAWSPSSRRWARAWTSPRSCPTTRPARCTFEGTR